MEQQLSFSSVEEALQAGLARHQAGDLGAAAAVYAAVLDAAPSGRHPRAAQSGALRRQHYRAERDHMVEALTRHRGDVRALGRELDLSRARVYQLMKKHGLDAARFRSA